MMRRLVLRRDGGAALEFAFVAPAMLFLVVAGLVFCLRLWIQSSLQQVSAETARCVAIASPNCQAVRSGCDSASPGICYAEFLARSRGLTAVTAANVTIDTGASFGPASATSVTVTFPFALAGYTFDLQAVGTFVNG